MKPPSQQIIPTLLLSALLAATGCHTGKQTPSVGSGKGVAGDVARNSAEARAQTDKAYDLIQKGDLKGARTLLERAIILDPLYGPAVNDLGVIDFRTDRLYDAAWRFENAIKLMPRQPEPANNLGLVLENAGKYADAEKQYDAASLMDLQNVEFAANRARVRVRQGKMDSLTRRLLDYVVLHDPRPDWVDWARLTLTLVRSTEAPQAPTPVPAETSP